MAIRQRLSLPEIPDDKEKIEELNRRLQEKGWMEPLGPSLSPDPDPNFQPIPNSGKPPSEIILESRE